MLFASATDSPHNDEAFQTFWQAGTFSTASITIGAAAQRGANPERHPGPAARDRRSVYILRPARRAGRCTTASRPPVSLAGSARTWRFNADGNLVIISPYTGFPASEAGLLPQDQIREVAGRSLEGMSVREAVGLLRGEIGTDVTLTVFRPSENRLFEVTLTRVRVELPTVDARLIGRDRLRAAVQLQQQRDPRCSKKPARPA